MGLLLSNPNFIYLDFKPIITIIPILITFDGLLGSLIDLPMRHAFFWLFIEKSPVLVKKMLFVVL